MNIDDISNTYLGSFQATSAEYYHTTSADLRARGREGSVCRRNTENDVDISWWSCLSWRL
jgi:hypothetical protein